jgi:voltage-gated potassium channel
VSTDEPNGRILRKERWRLLLEVQALVEVPLTILGFVWLALLILEFTSGLPSPLQTLANIIWALFVVDFLVRLVIAPSKGVFLRRNWLSAISLLLPALRVLRTIRAFRLLRAVRLTRSVSLVRLITSLNRGLRSTRRAFGQRGLGSVAVMTTVVTFTGAAGMALFESPAAVREMPAMSGAAPGGLANYGEALWWTGMIMTTLGSDYWPRTPEGRLLTILLALYAFAVFGYITAAIASVFIGRDQQRGNASNELIELRQEIIGLRDHIARLQLQIVPPNSIESRVGAGSEQLHGSTGAERQVSGDSATLEEDGSDERKTS